MTVLALPEPGSSPRQVPLDVEIIVPVYNEAPHLAERITELRRFLDQSFPFRALVTVVDNASTDDDLRRGHASSPLPPRAWPQSICPARVGATRCARPGRRSTAPVVAYMDVDLSTSLSALLPLVAPLLSGQRDVAIGTRLARGAHVVRGPKRELISRAYNLLLKLSVRGRFSDAQCGFKALRRESALQLLPLVKDDEWFFDTELLVTAQRLGLRISEVPVDWVDDPDSRVKIVRTALNDLRGVWRISHGQARRLAQSSATTALAPPIIRSRPTNSSASPASVLSARWGISSSSSPGGRSPGDFGANALALAICTIFNTAVHRELARNMTARRTRAASPAVAAGLFAISLALTTLALIAAHALSATSLAVALVAVTVANAVASVLRFAILRAWVFRPGAVRHDHTPRRQPHDESDPAPVGARVRRAPGAARRLCPTSPDAGAGRTRSATPDAGRGAVAWPVSSGAARATRPGSARRC